MEVIEYDNPANCDCTIALSWIEGDGYFVASLCSLHKAAPEMLALLNDLDHALQRHGTPKFLSGIRQQAKKLIRRFS